MSMTPFPWRTAGVLALSLCAVPAWPTAGALTTDVAAASAGYFQLAWQVDEPVRLVESRSATFEESRSIYDGADTARLMSGKPDGDWFYRLEAVGSGAVVAGPIRVRVAHHPIRRAVAFFGLGAAVFVATLGLIVAGNRADSI